MTYKIMYLKSNRWQLWAHVCYLKVAESIARRLMADNAVKPIAVRIEVIQ